MRGSSNPTEFASPARPFQEDPWLICTHIDLCMEYCSQGDLERYLRICERLGTYYIIPFRGVILTQHLIR